MTQLPEDYDSIFRYIVVVSQRAEQLINGAKPRTDSSAEKPTLQAIADVDAGQVGWRILTQEELDAQRQAIVDQFRAEVSDEAGLERREIPDVLPTADAKAAKGDAAEGEERDDELDRLQRLLGMIGGGAAPGADEGDALDAAEGSDALDDDSDDNSGEGYLDLEDDGDFGDSDDDSDDDD
jgi:DNA-directed RNA polymerase subunit K/omega